MLHDCADGDQPRQRKVIPDGLEPDASGAVMIGIIGGADGPTAIILSHNTPKLHAACSSLHFEQADTVEWRVVFSEKLMEDIEISLMEQL